ncbi:MAG: hypothetical protein ACE145_15710 [Terriglobia bacterium]
MKREKSLWILVIIALLFLVFWNLRSHAAPISSEIAPSQHGVIPTGNAQDCS